MAFNPFHAFRKHQKVVFAGLTILCMVTFVLTGSNIGRGDITDLIFGWMRSAKESDVAKLYDRKVTPQMLDYVKTQRILANQYMADATEAALGKRMEELEKKHGNMPNAKQQAFQMMFSDPDASKLWEQSMRNRMQPYFGGSFTAEGLLDFMIWQHQADQLGIRLTDADINEEIKRLTLKRLTPESVDRIEKQLRGNPRFKMITSSDLVAALGEELRVRMAKAALEGYEAGTKSQVPAPVTPDEFWDFYRDNRSEIQVTLFAVPVSDFLSQVTEKPTDKDLLALFNKYKTKEPSPESETPGFKQPRRLQVQWVSGRTDSPEAQKAGAVGLAIAQAATPQAFQLTLLHEYERHKQMFEFRAPLWTEPYFALSYYPGLSKPDNAASTFGQLLGAIQSLGTPLSVPVTAQAVAVARDDKDIAPVIAEEARQRIAVGCTLLLSGTTMNPLTPFTELTYANQQVQYVPLAAARKQLLERLQDGLAQEAAVSTLRNFMQQELDTKKADAKKDPKLLEEAAKKYGFKTGLMTETRTQHDIADDPALKPLKEAYIGSRSSLNRQIDKEFANFVFTQLDKVRPFEPERYPEVRSFSGQSDDARWRTDKEPFVFWKVKDEAAFTPPSWQKIRDQVETAWKMEKARELAQKEAQRIAKLAEEKKGDDPALRDLGAQLKKTPIKLGTVAKLVEKKQAMPGRGGEGYEPYTVPDSEIRYAGPEFTKQLLALKDKDKGTAVVIPDQPKATYYVAVQTGVELPLEGRFFTTFKQEVSAATQPDNFMMFGGGRSDTLWSRFEKERQEQYRKHVIEQLRAQANLKLTEEFKKRYEGGPGDE